MKNNIKSALIASTLIVTGAAFSGVAIADNMQHGAGVGAHAGVHRQPVDIAVILGLDATRAEQVNTILSDERAQRKALWEAKKGSAHDDASKAALREQMQSLRAGTKAKLTAVLTPEELQKLRDNLPHRGMHGHKQS